MIITLTPNPSLDRTVEVDDLVRGAVLRATRSHVDPGGKGVNVARALAAHGIKVRAVVPSGGAEGAHLASLLTEVDVVPVPIAGAIRTNVSVVEPDGTTTKINEPGPLLSVGETAALRDATVGAARAGGGGWVVCCGSLPRGVPEEFYADLVGALRAVGVQVAVDTSGPALTAALAEGPDLIKPNAEELAEASGLPVRTLGDALDAASALVRRGAGRVLASLGPDGALLVDGSTALHGEAPIDHLRSTVGAGDALLAGFLAAWDGPGSASAALAEALAWGAAAASLPGSRMPQPHDLARSRVRIHPDIDLTRAL